MNIPDDAVVISGIAPISALGIGPDSTWDALVAGECGLAKITRFDTSDFPVKLAGEVLDVDPAASLDRRVLVATDRWTHLGLIATELALRHADLDLAGLDPYSVAVITAASSGGNEFGQREIEALWSRGPRSVTVFQSIAWFYAATTGQISIGHGSKGMCGVLAGGGGAGLDIFAQAARALRADTNIALVGATEASVSPYALTCQLGTGLLSTSDDPAAAYQPFDRDASGYVVGEGGAMCVLERAEHCRNRGGRPLAVVAGHAATHDGRRGLSSDPGVAALGLCEAIEQALARAGINANNIDVIFADGVGSPERDHIEATALRLALGLRVENVEVTVPKAATGRMEAASACFDVSTAVAALGAQVVPPTVNVRDLAATCDLNVASVARSAALRYALVVARSHGGANSALVLGSPW